MSHPTHPTRRGGVLAGCLIVLAIVIAIVAGIAIYVGLHWKGWAADVMEQATTAIVNESGLPQDQKNQIVADVKKLGTDFKDGKVSLEQMQKVGEAIADSPLIHLAGVQAARLKYIEPSDMTAEEKAAANRSLQRFARGVFENKIPKETIDDVVKPITTLKPDGKWELKEKPTRQELDQFVANAKAKADDAKIPDEAFDLNIATELKKAIDKALGR
jgi:hypothetical protein